MTQTVTDRQEYRPLFLQKFVHGSIAGTVEVLVNQWLVGLKNELQKGNGFKQTWNQLSFRILYSGALANATGMSCVTGIQTMVRERSLSYTTETVSAMIAGASGALFACPTELIMDRKREAAKIGPSSYLQELQKLIYEKGIMSLYKGLFYTAIRDAGFATTYFVGARMLEKPVEELSGRGISAKIISGVMAGVVGSVVTHPFDTLKTRAQNWDSTAKISFSELYRGFTPRATRVTSAVCLLNLVIQKLEELTLQ